MRSSPFVASLVIALVLVATLPARAQLTLDVAYPSLTFNAPLDFEHADDGSNRVYVVERNGVVRVFDNDEDVATTATFLDIQSQVSTFFEGGLLGLAFHPDYADNGYFYLSYTPGSPFRSRVSRFTRSDSDPEQADPDSELILFEIPQPAGNHNGGDLAFGADGYLYASFGDGGGGGDPDENGQDPTTLLGAILRLDVDGGGAAPDCGGTTANYTIPDNAIADGAGGSCDEIFAWGLRNPFRFSFDLDTGTLWAADVGQSAREEVDIIADGNNLGWNTYEGTSCFDGPCDPAGLTFPVWEYGRSQGNSITGGFVYRGDGVPELAGKYVYGDFGSGRIWALEVPGVGATTNEQLFDTSLGISSFGEDAAGELYLTDLFGGRVYRFNFESDTSGEAPPEGVRFEIDGPTPFRGQTAFRFRLAETGPARVAVYDTIGREVAVLFDATVGARDVSVAFDAAGLAAGLYLVRFEGGGLAETRTVSLVR